MKDFFHDGHELEAGPVIVPPPGYGRAFRSQWDMVKELEGALGAKVKVFVLDPEREIR